MIGKNARYFAYALTLVAVLAVVGTVGRGLKGLSVSACQVPPSPDLFVAFCPHKAFGNYEHEAFWYDSEPEAVSNAQHADVLFSGSSQTMFAFSTDAVGRYFSAKKLPYFLLGFGYTDRDAFFLKLNAKYHFRPRVLVVGADPYFGERESDMARDVTGHPLYWWSRAWALKTAMEIKAFACARGFVSCGGGATLFRSRTDGRWHWSETTVADPSIPREHGRGGEWKPSEQDGIKDAARSFIKATGMNPACIIVVPIPAGTEWERPNPMQNIAAELGMSYIDPEAPGLTTVDGTHLSHASAEQFSAAFVREFGRIAAPCLRSPA